MTTLTEAPADLSEEELAAALHKLRSSLPAAARDVLEEVSEQLEEKRRVGMRDAKNTTALQLIAASYLALKSRH